MDRFTEGLGRLALDAVILTHPPNLRYLFGFTGSTGLALVTPAAAHLLVDSRYREQARHETRDCTVHQVSSLWGDALRDLLGPGGGRRRLGFEAAQVRWRDLETVRAWKSGWRLTPGECGVEAMRARKDPTEIAILTQAFQRAQQAFSAFRTGLRRGVSEIEAAGLLEYCCRQAGSEGTAFETIIASGPRASLPHAAPTSRSIAERDVLLIDFGIRFQGYCSDLTRVLGTDLERVASIYGIVEQAQAAAIKAVRPGVPAREIDRAARAVIRAAGYGDCFGHSTGHGIGLEVHELPLISESNAAPLEPGMVFSIEPGIYLPGEFGIRLEDVVQVTDRSCERLS